MASELVRQLVDSGIHFGHRVSRWNPKMRPYIFGKRNLIHIIDIRETVKGLLRAKRFIAQTVSKGQEVLFVGTKRQARDGIRKHAEGVNMPWVAERWLGGTLTNHRTIRERLKRLEELEQLVESGEIENYSKKMASQLLREKRKITRNLQGIRNMNTLPGALVIIDVGREINALREARGLGIPTIALVDSDGDPDLVDIPIPGNDDSMRSIDVVMRELCEAVRQGKMSRPSEKEQALTQATDDDSPRRRSSRAMFRAAEPPTPAPEAETVAAPTQPIDAPEPASAPAAPEAAKPNAAP